MWIWNHCYYNLNMIFKSSSSMLCTLTIILSIVISSLSTSELIKPSISMYDDTTSDPNFPWTYARIKRQIYREQIPQDRPLDGNLYAFHGGFPHPGRWHPFPGGIIRPNPNSGHHFDNPNVILSDEDFERYGSTLQHIDHHNQKNKQPILDYLPGYEYPQQYNEQSQAIPSPQSSSGEVQNDDGIVHHKDGDLPVKILIHHHYHAPIIAKPMVHPVDPKDQGKLVEFEQNGIGDPNLIPTYGQSNGIIENHGGPIHSVEQEQEPIVENIGTGYHDGGSYSDGHIQEEQIYGGEQQHGYGSPHFPPVHTNRPLSSLLNIHNLIFGPMRRPTHHVPILKSIWPSAYGRWRHRPFSWSFSN